MKTGYTLKFSTTKEFDIDPSKINCYYFHNPYFLDLAIMYITNTIATIRNSGNGIHVYNNLIEYKYEYVIVIDNDEQSIKECIPEYYLDILEDIVQIDNDVGYIHNISDECRQLAEDYFEAVLNKEECFLDGGNDLLYYLTQTTRYHTNRLEPLYFVITDEDILKKVKQFKPEEVYQLKSFIIDFVYDKILTLPDKVKRSICNLFSAVLVSDKQIYVSLVGYILDNDLVKYLKYAIPKQCTTLLKEYYLADNRTIQ